MSVETPAFHPLTLDHGDIGAYRQRKIALITGITGQDGSYLYVPSHSHIGREGNERCIDLDNADSGFRYPLRTELLLGKGYEVHGIIRRSSSFNTGRLHHLYEV